MERHRERERERWRERQKDGETQRERRIYREGKRERERRDREREIHTERERERERVRETTQRSDRLEIFFSHDAQAEIRFVVSHYDEFKLNLGERERVRERVVARYKSLCHTPFMLHVSKADCGWFPSPPLAQMMQAPPPPQGSKSAPNFFLNAPGFHPAASGVTVAVWPGANGATWLTGQNLASGPQGGEGRTRMSRCCGFIEKLCQSRSCTNYK